MVFGGNSFRYAYFRFLYGTEIDYIKTKSNKKCEQCIFWVSIITCMILGLIIGVISIYHTAYSKSFLSKSVLCFGFFVLFVR